LSTEDAQPRKAGPLLEVEDLRVHFPTREGLVKAVDGVSFSVSRGETLGVVGESGSGKSVTMLTVMGLVTRREARISGRAVFDGVDLLELEGDAMRKIRGSRIGMIFQDPLTALNPVHKVGNQIAEVLRVHRGTAKREALEESVGLLEQVGIPRPRERAGQYPHEYSGGMRQRAMIAMALALQPDLLIADEPTTALDVTVQAQILELIRRIQDELGTAVLLITHDLGVVAEYCDRISVMYAGRVVEQGSDRDVFYHPRHPYTWGLLQSIARIDQDRDTPLRPIEGQPPSLIHVPSGCAFHPRCPHAMDVCRTEVPALHPADAEHPDACHLPEADKVRIGESLRDRAGGPA
jgi:oligopeptide/dipeptide ABC transporter ATP-binding protein